MRMLRTDPTIAQTFKKVDSQIVEITPDPIVIPAAEAELPSHALPSEFEKIIGSSI